MRFGAFHTYERAIDRKTRKALGRWNEDFAKEVWTTKEGKRIKVRDMGHDHLTNTIKLIYRKAATHKLQDDALFLTGPFPQGEMATMAFDEAADEQFGRDTLEYVPDIFHAMMEEAQLRGIDIELLEAYFRAVEDKRFTLGLRAIIRARDIS